MVENIESFLSKYDNFVSPVIITDKNGIIIYKNKALKLYGSYRKGSNISKYIHANEKLYINDCISNSVSGIFRLNNVYGNSYCCMVPCEENPDLRIVAVIPGVALLKNTQNEIFTERNIEYCLRCRILALETFKESIKANTTDEKTNKRYESLLSRSNMLVFRSIHHNTVAIEKYKTLYSHNSYKSNKLSDLSACIREVFKISTPYCNTLGYRIKSSVPENSYSYPVYAQVSHSDFISVLTSCLTLSLRLSADGKCEYNYFCESNHLFINFSFRYGSKIVFGMDSEIEFIADAARINGWDFSFVHADNGRISLMIPTEDNTNTTLRQNTEEFSFDKSEQYILRAELCMLEEFIGEEEITQ